MTVALQLEPVDALPAVDYRWDPDTEILTAAVRAASHPAGSAPRGDAVAGASHVAEPAGGSTSSSMLTLQSARPSAGPSGSIEVEGADGSWLTLELSGGRVLGVQVAVWPPVRRSPTLTPPSGERAQAIVASAGGDAADIVSLEMSTRVRAESDLLAHTFHFSFGGARASRCARIATDLLLELDGRGRLAGVWLLNVPPLPESP